MGANPMSRVGEEMRLPPRDTGIASFRAVLIGRVYQ